MPHAKAKGGKSVCRADGQQKCSEAEQSRRGKQGLGQKGKQVTTGPTSSRTTAFLQERWQAVRGPTDEQRQLPHNGD